MFFGEDRQDLAGEVETEALLWQTRSALVSPPCLGWFVIGWVCEGTGSG